MIVAVTGGTGFVGARLVQAHLASGDEVRVLTRHPAGRSPSGAYVVHGDLATGCIPDAFAKNADVLYHCAGEIRHESKMHALHVEGTRRLVARAAGHVGRWVQLSSVGVYGPRRTGTVTEDTPEAPVGPYEETKALSDAIVRHAHARGTIDAVIVRPSIIFGPDMPNRSLFALVEAVDRGRFVYIGPRGASANYVPVDNVVDALLLCGRSSAAPGGVFNVSAWTTIEDFITTVAAALGKNPPRLRLPLAGARGIAAILSTLPRWPLTVSRVDALSTRVVYSTARIESVLGYRPRLLLEDALRLIVAYWRDHRGRV